ncbi:hypothetical protein KPH14_007579 [Odynerus spinipes]|uniref:Ribosomal protein eL8/eL30/eS12/Gadd45 domain-containing protein n=1 Tax=Odynerus spinipes TaxID=1348599 RepID=A0AAD9RHL0_9HYME|nr:hypothetical protein KPH14_007579 [Odynerus spinipes]
MDQSNNVCSAWLYRLQIETKSEADQAWPQLNSQSQTKHNVQRNEQRYNRRYVTDSTVDMCSEDSLDIFEYPELGERKVKIKSTPDIVISCQETVTTGNLIPDFNTKVKNKKAVGPSRYKRTEKISFDLRGALESAGYFSGKNAKKPMKLRVNVYKVNTNPCNKNSPNDKSIELKKVKLYNIKPKKPSRLKRKILLERWTNRQIRRQEHQDNRRKEKNSMDVNIYDKDYRNSKTENIPEDTVQFRPDVVQKLDDLWISNLQNRNISTLPYKSALDNTDDLTTLQHILSIKDEDDIESKPDIKFLSDRNELIRYSKNFREYCNNLVTPSLNESLEKFLSEIKRLQTKLYDRDPTKGKYKRRYYAGLKEVQKHVALRKIRFVVIAPNIEKIRSEGGLDEEVDQLLEICRKNETVFCFGLRRRKLGYYAHGNGLVGCIGITNYGNVEQLFWDVLLEVVEARNKYEKLQGRSERTIDVSKIIHENNLLTENIGILLKALASIN